MMLGRRDRWAYELRRWDQSRRDGLHLRPGIAAVPAADVRQSAVPGERVGPGVGDRVVSAVARSFVKVFALDTVYGEPMEEHTQYVAPRRQLRFNSVV
jgi:hypothetical protein